MKDGWAKVGETYEYQIGTIVVATISKDADSKKWKAIFNDRDGTATQRKYLEDVKRVVEYWLRAAVYSYNVLAHMKEDDS